MYNFIHFRSPFSFRWCDQFCAMRTWRTCSAPVRTLQHHTHTHLKFLLQLIFLRSHFSSFYFYYIDIWIEWRNERWVDWVSKNRYRYTESQNIATLAGWSEGGVSENECEKIKLFRSNCTRNDFMMKSTPVAPCVDDNNDNRGMACRARARLCNKVEVRRYWCTIKATTNILENETHKNRILLW